MARLPADHTPVYYHGNQKSMITFSLDIPGLRESIRLSGMLSNLCLVVSDELGQDRTELPFSVAAPCWDVAFCLTFLQESDEPSDGILPLLPAELALLRSPLQPADLCETYRVLSVKCL